MVVVVGLVAITGLPINGFVDVPIDEFVDVPIDDVPIDEGWRCNSHNMSKLCRMMALYSCMLRLNG